MKYRIEIYDTEGRRVARFDQAPLLEVRRTTPDQADTIEGSLPVELTNLSHGYRVRVLVEDEVVCEARVTSVAAKWSDTRQLVLDRYVYLHELVECVAERPALEANTTVAQICTAKSVSDIVKLVIDSALGPVHYLVAHSAYPDGAQREYAKFMARKTSVNELAVGGIGSGQWVGSARMDLSGVYAKDGDTIAGLVVDGVPWPDVRLMLVDCEEMSKNSHAVKRHPEVAAWTPERYLASGYRLRADAATAALQGLVDTKGIDYIELNPHMDSLGEFDDRVDAYGRYIGMVYGGGECFSAALVEKGLGDVYLYEDGKYHVPEMALKHFFSYTRETEDSIEYSGVILNALDAGGGVLEVLTLLAYAAGGFIWSLDNDSAVRFRKALRPDYVVFHDPVEVGVTLGSASSSVVNILNFEGSLYDDETGSFANVEKTYWRWPSVNEYGEQAANLAYWGLANEDDVDRVCAGLLDDVAYPELRVALTFFNGKTGIRVGNLVEVRGGRLRRLDRELAGEWGDRFRGRFVGRVCEVTHRFCGNEITTIVRLTSPLRSVANPLTFMTRSQSGLLSSFAFCLDEPTMGLDMNSHLD